MQVGNLNIIISNKDYSGNVAEDGFVFCLVLLDKHNKWASVKVPVVFISDTSNHVLVAKMLLKAASKSIYDEMCEEYKINQ